MGVATRTHLSSTLRFLKHLYCQWDTLNVPKMAASLTYYTTVALAPLIGVFLAAVGLAFGSATARDHLIEAVKLEIGETGASLIRTMAAHVGHPKLNVGGTVIGALALFFGATGAFIDLKNSLKVIWHVPETGSGGLGSFLLARIISFAMVLITGAIGVLSISISVSISTLHHYFGNWITVNRGQGADLVLSFAVTTALFAVIYRVVPPERMPWRHIAFGAAITAALFTGGKAAIAAYIGSVNIGSPYGTAGTLFAFLIWLYYSSQVFFIGAIITRSRTRVDRIAESHRSDGEVNDVGSMLGLEHANRSPQS
jgi:membrane protein